MIGWYNYPIVDIRGGINDLSPEEALAKSVAHWLALPTYVVNFQGGCSWLWVCTHSFSKTKSAVVSNCLTSTYLDNVFSLFKNHIAFGTIHLMRAMSFWKPRYIPSANTLDIPHHQFEALKVKSCDSIKTDIEQD